MAVIEIDALVDARGLSCPMPIVRTAQTVRGMAPGTILELLATDPGSVKDVAAWCRATGHDLLESTSDGEIYHFVIRRK